MMFSSLGLIVAVSLSAQDRVPEPTSKPARMTIFQRVAPAQLEKFDRDRAAFAKTVKAVEVPYPFVRGTFHMHSALSHDSRGKMSEIIAAAKATNTRIVGMSEHPSDTVDNVAQGYKGMKDGVYFLAGLETNNSLYWPGVEGEKDLRFVSHPEEVPTFDRSKYDGMEIYNTHTDVLDEPMKKVVLAVVLNFAAVKAHPEAGFVSFFDYPADFLARYDRLVAEAPFGGVAANDSHQNVYFKLVAMPDTTAEVYDVTGKRIYKAEGMTAALLRAAFGSRGPVTQPTVVTEMQLDPYLISMRHVGTFLQITEVNEKTVRHGLRTGRAILGFEIIAPLPSVGFWVEREGKPSGTVGDQVAFQDGLTLRCLLPAEADLRVIHNGQTVHQSKGATCTVPITAPGAYRFEAFVTLAGERYPWVISNPIYITPKK